MVRDLLSFGEMLCDLVRCGGGEPPQPGSFSTINFLSRFSEVGLLHVSAKITCPL